MCEGMPTHGYDPAGGFAHTPTSLSLHGRTLFGVQTTHATPTTDCPLRYTTSVRYLAVCAIPYLPVYATHICIGSAHLLLTLMFPANSLTMPVLHITYVVLPTVHRRGCIVPCATTLQLVNVSPQPPAGVVTPPRRSISGDSMLR